MKNFKIIAFFIFISFANTAWALEDTILAVVNDAIITEKDLNDHLSAVYLQLKSEGRSDSDIKEILEDQKMNGIEKLIENKILVDEANQKSMTIRNKTIDSRYEELRKGYPSEEEFLKALASEGLTVTDIRNKITDNLKTRYIIEEEVKSKIFVNPQEVTAFYEQNKNEFQALESVRLESIFISYQKDGGKKDAKRKVSEIFNILKKEDFTQVAKTHSQAPSVGIIRRGETLSAIENTVFGLKEGEVSKSVETDNGIFIFKLIEKVPPKTLSLEEAKDQIYNLLSQEKFRARYKEWIAKLKAKAYVEIKN